MKRAADATDREERSKGETGAVMDWQIVYGDMKPNDRCSFENYVPEDAPDLNTWLTAEYGPWGSPHFSGYARAFRRSETVTG